MSSRVGERCDVDGVRLDSITIETSDVRRSIGLFRSLELVPAVVRSDPAFVSHRVPEFRIDWVVSTATPRDLRLGVRCAAPSDVDRIARLLDAAGHQVRRGPVDESWGCRTAVLVDPDGHLVELYAPYP